MRIHAHAERTRIPAGAVPDSPVAIKATRRPEVRAALRIGAGNDPLEKEADRVADQVLRMPVQSGPVELQRCPGGCPPGGCGDHEEVRRQPIEEEEELLQPKLQSDLLRQPMEEEEEETLQAKQTAEYPAVSVTEHDLASAGRGAALPETVRRFYEPRLGRDLGDVRVHTGDRADALNRQLHARAFTRASDIFFGAGEWSPGTDRGRRLLGHELTHVIQQTGQVQRQEAPPTYRDCTARITGVSDANERLENGRQRARGFVGSAIRTLGAAPTAGSTYATALARHFINPTVAQRATILANFRSIRGTLRVSNYICNSQNICGTEQAFWIPQDDLVHVCRPFWTLGRNCRGIVLVHEGAHDIGVDSAIAGHTPNRGSASYPAGNVAPPAGVTTAQRIQNPDAYAFFAAHLWRGTDTSLTCF